MSLYCSPLLSINPDNPIAPATQTELMLEGRAPKGNGKWMRFRSLVLLEWCPSPLSFFQNGKWSILCGKISSLWRILSSPFCILLKSRQREENQGSVFILQVLPYNSNIILCYIRYYIAWLGLSSVLTLATNLGPRFSFQLGKHYETLVYHGLQVYLTSLLWSYSSIVLVQLWHKTLPPSLSLSIFYQSRSKQLISSFYDSKKNEFLKSWFINILMAIDHYPVLFVVVSFRQTHSRTLILRYMHFVFILW